MPHSFDTSCTLPDQKASQQTHTIPASNVLAKDSPCLAVQKFDPLNATLDELVSFFTKILNQPAFRAKQLWKWLWQKNVFDIDAMTDISKPTRELLKASLTLALPTIVSTQKSSDGTVKFLLQLADSALIETVLIPSEDREGNVRVTQCLSSQVGCVMACTFCSTGAMGFERNLTHGEILAQVLVAKEYLGDTRPDYPILRNLVFMGMGEPLLNMQELLRSLETLNNPDGLNFSPRRITVSTCGIEKGLKQLGESGLAFLAISLHAPTQALRKKIMPKAAQWDLQVMLDTLAHYPLKTRERITFEYILLGGVNDSVQHAEELCKLMAGIKSKLNLIIYNPSETAPYKAPTEKAIEAFQHHLWQKNITAIIRKSKGQDIQAACGQLKTMHEKKTLSTL